MAYAELHCHTNFSFLDGASHPEELVDEAARLGLAALAVTDHDGFYGIVRFAQAAKAYGLPTVFGAELTLGATQPPPRANDRETGIPARGAAALPTAPAGAGAKRGDQWSRRERARHVGPGGHLRHDAA